jgi:ankyrin repeat protein
VTAPDRELIGRFIDAVVDDPSVAEALLASHPELREARWLHDETPLHFLAVEGYLEGVRWLAAHGFGVNTPNRFGDTALVDVASMGQAEMVRLLVGSGADPNASSKVHGTALLAAVNSLSLPTVQALVSAGAAPVLPGIHEQLLRLRMELDRNDREAMLPLLRTAFPEVKFD